MKLELSHDTLAQTIYNKASANDKMLVKKQNFIKRRYAYYLDSDVLLDLEGLDYIGSHLNKLILDDVVLAFLRRSERYVKRRKLVRRAIIFSSSLVLLIFGIQASVTFYELQVNIKNKKRIYSELRESQNQRSIAENKAQLLLDGVGTIDQEDLQNKDIVKQMIIKYDTLGKQQIDAAQERDLAQSATLSDLAFRALKQEDRAYALQLASKAWELNPENKQALDLLEKVNEQKEIAFSEYSSNKQVALVQKSQKKTGRLEDEDLAAIFSKENEVGKNNDIDVKRSVAASNRKGTTEENVSPSFVPALSHILQEKNEKMPILQAVKQSLAPEVNLNKINCFIERKDVDKWLPVKEKKVWSLYIKFSSDGKLYMRIVFNEQEDIIGLPNLTHLRFNNLTEMKIINLIPQQNIKKRTIYVVDLSEEDKDWLKVEKLTGFSFSIEELDLSKFESFEEEFSLEPEVQNKLIKMGKCLL